MIRPVTPSIRVQLVIEDISGSIAHQGMRALGHVEKG
jgi:hypothetical protein